MPKLSKILITAALPYANAKLHLGHLRSTYIPSDIYARYLRLKGEQVIYICASDEHGTPIAVRAEKEGITPQEYVDKYHKLIKEDLEKVGCSFNIFSRTTHPTHAKLTQEFFIRLLENGYIYDAEYEQLFCSNCKRFLPDRYVEGICPYCGAEGARGDACEACGRYLKPTELKEPYCVICHSKPNVKKTRHWFFKLSALQKFLEDWITKNDKLPANVKHYASQWLREGLKDWCITRDLNWGVPVPVKGGEGKVIYVWFDAPIGYVSATKVLFESIGKPDAWKEYWQKDGTFIHFIGKDIIYHHAIFWPAMLKCHGDYNLPTTLVASEFLTLEGKKMSKSRGWVVEISDYLKTFEPDSLRYYLTVVSPLHKDADFSWDDFGRRHNDELADILGNFIHRALTFTYRNFNKKIPQPGKLDEYDLNVLNAIKETHKRVTEQIESFNFHVAVKSAIELAALGNRYLNEKQPWTTVKTVPEKAGTALYISNQIVKALAIMLEPFIPFTAETIWQLLNLPGSVHEQNWNEAIKEIPPGHKLNPPKPIFKKIEPTTIESQKKMLQESLEAAGKPMISIEEFSRLEIKAGTIIGVEPISGSNKLLKLTIDLGESGVRQAVTGIAPWYKPDELQGKQIAVLTNIKPVKMFGVESQVMILAAEDEKTVSILTPDKPVKPGSKIR
ncbi:MAG: methionine--tRNA ligase [Candidatus Bathyarchaeia archaeon]